MSDDSQKGKPLRHRVYMNARPVPERKPGESEADWQARLANYRAGDRRIAVAGLGMPNFAFDHVFYEKGGAIGLSDSRPRVKMEDGDLTGEVDYRPCAGGSFSQV